MKLNLDIFISIYHQILLFFPFWEDEESVFCSSTLIIRSLFLTTGSRYSGADRSFFKIEKYVTHPLFTANILPETISLHLKRYHLEGNIMFNPYFSRECTPKVFCWSSAQNRSSPSFSFGFGHSPR